MQITQEEYERKLEILRSKEITFVRHLPEGDRWSGNVDSMDEHEQAAGMAIGNMLKPLDLEIFLSEQRIRQRFTSEILLRVLVGVELIVLWEDKWDALYDNRAERFGVCMSAPGIKSMIRSVAKEEIEEKEIKHGTIWHLKKGKLIPTEPQFDYAKFVKDFKESRGK